MKPSTFKIWLAMLSVYIVWGSTYLAIRFAVETMPPFLMGAFRFLTAGGILYAWRIMAGDPRPVRIEWRSAAVVGLFLIVGGNGNVVWAEQRVASGVAALLVASSPLWMVIIDSLLRLRYFRGKAPAGDAVSRPGWVSVLGVLVGFAGILLLVGPQELTGIAGGVDPLGAASLTLGSFLWAAGSLYSRGARLPSSPLLGTALEMIAGGFGLLVLATLAGDWARLDLAAIAPRSLWGLLYLILFGSLVGFAAYTWLLRVAPTTLVSTYAYVNPLVAIFAGNLLAQEPLTPRVLIATAIILGSVALITAAQPGKAISGPKTAQAAALTSGDD